MVKSSVALLNWMTIPPLELTAAVLAVHVDWTVPTEMQMQLEQSVFWTDSMTVLKYIRN